MPGGYINTFEVRVIHSHIYRGSKIIAYLALGIIVGLIVGLLVGYSTAGSRTGTESQSQVMKLQKQISNLQDQLARKDNEISTLKTNVSRLERTIKQLQSLLMDWDRQIEELQDQLSSSELLIQRYREQLISLEKQTNFLREEIDRIANTTRIVQSEEYLLNMTGILRISWDSASISAKSTYFTTLGKQIKAELKLRVEPPVREYNYLFIKITVYYSYGGTYVEVCSESLYIENWDFYIHPQISLTFYLKLDKIPQEYFGKVPLFIELYINAYSNCSTYLYYELTAYDVYPP